MGAVGALLRSIELDVPQGALERGGKRARAVGDYEAWSPDA